MADKQWRMQKQLESNSRLLQKQLLQQWQKWHHQQWQLFKYQQWALSREWQDLQVCLSPVQIETIMSLAADACVVPSQVFFGRGIWTPR